jgi:betaine-aldehyde dehydrogenase
MEIFTLQKSYINGSFTESSSHETFENICPGTGLKLCDVQIASKDDVDHAVASAKKAFVKWSQQTGAQRGRLLWKAAQIIREQADDLTRLETLDSGKPISESILDVIGTAEVLEYFGGLAHAIHGQHISLGSSFAYTRREPYGVCAGIGAWNYPLLIASWKMAPALASGNTLVFKPSELTPMSALRFAEILTEAGLPPGVLNIVQGPASVGDHLVRHKDVAKVSLTGSIATGKKILNAVADKVIPVTLELGGKSPLILFKDCDLKQAVRGAMLANFFCQGEVCSNGTRVFVEDSLYDVFISELMSSIRSLRVGNPLDPQTQMGALISNAHKEKVLKYIATGKKEGAHLLYGGESVQMDAPCQSGFYIQPTVFTECSDDMTIVKEEIFGPVMSVLRFKSEEEVIERANNTDFGLAAGVFTQNLQKAHRVVAQLQAGICWINTHNFAPVEIPFGAYKQSGLGRENGTAALDHYSQIKTVYVEMGELPS